jgi:hypothetical protein
MISDIVYCSDITYTWTKDPGYLAVILDLEKMMALKKTASEKCPFLLDHIILIDNRHGRT